MITVKKLTKSFGSSQALRSIDLHIEKGSIYGLAGRSGAGKSTLLRCINGLEPYDDGSLVVNGSDVKALSSKDMRELRKNIGMIFQQFSLLDRLTVYENIALPLRCWKYDSKRIDKKVKDLLELVGIPEKIHERPRNLSGGQKQRVAIARALTMDAQILLCDEATSALDPSTSKAIIGLLSRINRQLGITIVIVTHQMSVLRSACEEMTILERGRVAATGTVEDLFLQQPKALKNLIGENGVSLPDDGINISIFLSHDDSMKTLPTRMARELDIDFAILEGGMEMYRDRPMGSIMINVAERDYSKVERYLTEHEAKWRTVRPEAH